MTLQARVFARNADPSFEALRAVNRGGGAVIRAFSSPNTATAATEILELDTHGNLIISGTLTSNGTPMSVARTKQSARVAFGPQQSMATTEDFGETQLIAGQAIVRLDPAFASTMDARAPCMVFLTAQGETHGNLYVAQKTQQGFIVRETLGGRSNVAFDYRVVARPLGSNAQRLPAFSGNRSISHG